jgi:hypothetical protein
VFDTTVAMLPSHAGAFGKTSIEGRAKRQAKEKVKDERRADPGG